MKSGSWHMSRSGASSWAGTARSRVGGAGVGVAQAGEPKALAVALDGDELVDQRGDAVAGEGVEDALGADGDVVVAEDGVA